MKKILIILWCHPKWWSWVEKVSYEIWKKLSKEYDVSYFFQSNKKSFEKEWNIIFLWKKMIKTYLFDAFIFSIYSYFYLKKNKYDLIIDNIWINLFNKTKTFTIAHWTHINFFKKIKFKNYLDKLKYFLFFWFINWFIVKKSLKKSNKIITFWETIKEELIKEYNLNYNKIKIISNWCDKIFFDTNQKQNTKIKILFISNDHIRKWIDILEKVSNYFINNDNIEFLIIWREYNSKNKNIKYLWKLPRNEVYENMKNSNIIFLPSYYEWQPLVIIEAMNFWCIPLVSKNCHLDFLWNTKLEQFISERNETNFYIEKISFFLENIDYLENLSELSKIIVNNMSWDKVTDEYLEFINEFLN